MEDIIITEREKDVLIQVPLYVPIALYKGGAVEALARYDGWTEKVTGPDNVEIDNPLTPLEFNVKNIQNVVKEKYRIIMVRQGEESGRKQADDQFNALFK